MTTILNYLHSKGFTLIVVIICRLIYLLKYKRYYEVCYDKCDRIYRITDPGGFIMHTAGPGWAYTRTHLEKQLLQGFNLYFYPKENNVVLDVGSGLGEEVLVYSKIIGIKGRLIAVEANPTTFSLLVKLVDQNKLPNVELLNLAIADTEGPILMQDNFDSYLANSIITKNSDVLSEKMASVEGITFESLLLKLNVEDVDFLKMNIEGAERYIASCDPRVFRRIKNLCISCHDFRHTEHNAGEFYITRHIILNYLISAGYEVRRRKTENSMWDDCIYAKLPT